MPYVTLLQPSKQGILDVKDFVLAICTFFYKIVKLNSHRTGSHHLVSNTPESLIGVNPLAIAGAAR
jgi:hypothetical protein